MGARHVDFWSPRPSFPDPLGAQHRAPLHSILALSEVSRPARSCWRVSPSELLTILPGPLPSSVVPTGIEDKDAWHGKPLPKNMADQIVQEIYNQIQSKKKILVTPPQEDAPSVSITSIRMPSPPSYKVGDKVQSWALLFWSGWGGHDSLVP